MDTATQLLDRLLPRFCGTCGLELPEPGTTCAGCGTLPQVTREEAAERLALPGAITALAAAECRERARRRQDEASADLLEADRVEHMARLQDACDKASGAVLPATAEAVRLAGDLETAQAAEREAIARAEDARANYRAAADADEAARRTRAPASERTETGMRLASAAKVLAGDQAAEAAAVAAREQAERALKAACDRVGAAEDELARAKAGLDDPGRIPRSIVTITMDLARQAQDPSLTDAEKAAVRTHAYALAQMTGAAGDIATHAIERHRQDTEEAAGNRRVITTPLGDGFVAAWPNPLVPPPPTP